MRPFRTCFVITVFASVTLASAPKATLVVRQQQDVPAKYACTIHIIAVDGKPLKSPQQQITLSPGTHGISLRVKDARGIVYDSTALKRSFVDGHHYSVFGRFYPDGFMKVHMGDDDEPADVDPKRR